MSTPSAPAEAVAHEPVLGTGAYGDPAQPEQTRAVFAETHPDAEPPANPSSDEIMVSGPEGGVPDPNAALPVADGTPVQAPSTPAGTAAGSPVTPEAAVTS